MLKSNKTIIIKCHETLRFRSLPIATRDKLATIIRAVNYVKADAVNTKLFTTFAKI